MNASTSLGRAWANDLCPGVGLLLGLCRQDGNARGTSAVGAPPRIIPGEPGAGMAAPTSVLAAVGPGLDLRTAVLDTRVRVFRNVAGIRWMADDLASARVEAARR